MKENQFRASVLSPKSVVGELLSIPSACQYMPSVQFYQLEGDVFWDRQKSFSSVIIRTQVPPICGELICAAIIQSECNI